MKRLMKQENINKKKLINILILNAIICGVLGFFMEEFLFYFKLGYFVKRGLTFGPIIPIYAYGSFIIMFLSYKYKDKPLLVFLINSIALGALEYAVGYLLLIIKNQKLWDYSNEFLNINGLVCLKSAVFFGLGSLFVIYLLIPWLIKIVKKYDNKRVSTLAYFLGGTFLIDVILYFIIKN